MKKPNFRATITFVFTKQEQYEAVELAFQLFKKVGALAEGVEGLTCRNDDGSYSMRIVGPANFTCRFGSSYTPGLQLFRDRVTAAAYQDMLRHLMISEAGDGGSQSYRLEVNNDGGMTARVLSADDIEKVTPSVYVIEYGMEAFA